MQRIAAHLSDIMGGHPSEGAVSLAILTAFGLFFLLAGRSETIRGLRGDGRDERFAQIDLQATAVAGLALIVAWLVATARGQSGSPFDILPALKGEDSNHYAVWSSS